MTERVIGLLRRAVPWLAERPVLLFPAAFPGSFAVASSSYRHLEAPLLAQRERFRPVRRAASEAASLAPRERARVGA